MKYLYCYKLSNLLYEHNKVNLLNYNYCTRKYKHEQRIFDTYTYMSMLATMIPNFVWFENKCYCFGCGVKCLRTV